MNANMIEELRDSEEQEAYEAMLDLQEAQQCPIAEMYETYGGEA